MWHFPILSRMRHFHMMAIAVGLALSMLLITSVVGWANTVTISDAANVLNVSQVRSEAANLPYPIAIYTTNTFSGSTSAFDQQTRTHITSSNMLVMAIDTFHKHVTIVGGSSVRGSNSQYDAATQAFVSSYRSNNGDYTAATIAAIRSLRSNLGSSSTSNGNSSNTGSSASGGIFSGLFGTLCCIGLLVLIVGGIIFAVRRRGSGFGRRAAPMGDPAMYNQPYNQPYNQGYPPNYNQGGGINPLAAGGLGAAAGGLIGYELGKERGEDQMREQGYYQQGGNFDNGGGQFGGGSSADFGGGGGDFGGGSSADFGGGGGGDFGGGGGGGDFGGGGGGDFGGGGGGGGGGGDF